MRVLGLFGQRDQVGAVEVYRITLPFTHLNNQSETRCGWMTATDAADHLRADDTDTVFGNDIVVLHRMISDDPRAGLGAIAALKSRGAKIVYETDDDYSGRHRDADGVPGLVEGLGRTWAPYLPHVDAITVSTKPLAKLLREETGGRIPVHVIPNAIDYAWFAGVAQAAQRFCPEHLTVMLAGTKSHYQDWMVLKDVIPGILADYPHVKFLVAGITSEYLVNAGAETIAPVKYTAYPGILAQADILCAPLIPDDPFNAGKSPIKAIEGWCTARPVGKQVGGCAVIASKSVVYRGTVQNRHNGLLVDHTPEAWDAGLRKLIEDQCLRQKLQIQGHKDARRYDMATHWQDWHRVYTKIVNGGSI